MKPKHYILICCLLGAVSCSKEVDCTCEVKHYENTVHRGTTEVVYTLKSSYSSGPSNHFGVCSEKNQGEQNIDSTTVTRRVDCKIQY